MRRAASSRLASAGRAIHRRPQRAAGAALALVVAALVLWTFAEVLIIRADLEGARRDLVEVDLVTLAQEPGGVEALVDRAADRLASAERRARTSPILGLWDRLPVLGDQVGGIRDITGALAGIGERARDAGDAIQVRIDGLDRGPSARIDLLDEVLDHLTDLRSELQDVDLGDASLAGPIRWERDGLEEQLDKAHERLEDATGSVEAVRGLLVGPTRYLLLAGNNSEMRGTPMPLAGGLLEFDGGEITSSEMVQTDELRLHPGQAVEPPDDLVALYDGLWGLGREWRTTTTTPRFPVAAELLTEMSARSAIGAVDGVILIDAITLGAMTDAVGGIVVEGELRTGDQLVEQVLNTSYAEIPDTRRGRFDVQGELAEQAFEQLTEATDAIFDLAARVPTLTEGRHLMAWSHDPEVQGLWEDLGATGELHPQSFMVALQNASASKRDWYLDPAVTVHSGPSVSGDSLQVLATVTLDNPVLDTDNPLFQGTSRYVAPGEHRSFVTVYLPEGATDVGLRGTGAAMRSVGRDGPNVVLTAWFRVHEGTTGRFTVEFELPADAPAALIVPSARIRPMTYTVNGTAVTDDAPRVVFFIAPSGAVDGATRAGLSTAAAFGIAANVAAGTWVVRRRVDGRRPGRGSAALAA